MTRVDGMRTGRIGVMMGALLAMGWNSAGYELAEELEANGLMAGNVLYFDPSGGEADSEAEGAFVFQPEFGLAATEQDLFFAKFGFAAGNGLNEESPFRLATWAADLEDDVKEINGRNRDYLLTAGYRRDWEFSEDHQLGLSFGLLDSTGYLDENRFANDEFGQFLNEALVNSPVLGLPSYDGGGALEWDRGPLSLRGAVMNVGDNGEGDDFTFCGAQIGFRADSDLGEGNLRLTCTTTSDDFSNPAGDSRERLLGWGLSADQAIGNDLGVFARLGGQDDAAVVDYASFYSGGCLLKGTRWGRGDDTCGLGAAYLHGGNGGVDRSLACECFYRLCCGQHLALVCDAQYVKDDLEEAEDVRGFVASLRAVAEY